MSRRRLLDRLQRRRSDPLTKRPTDRAGPRVDQSLSAAVPAVLRARSPTLEAQPGQLVFSRAPLDLQDFARDPLRLQAAFGNQALVSALLATPPVNTPVMEFEEETNTASPERVAEEENAAGDIDGVEVDTEEEVASAAPADDVEDEPPSEPTEEEAVEEPPAEESVEPVDEIEGELEVAAVELEPTEGDGSLTEEAPELGEGDVAERAEVVESETEDDASSGAGEEAADEAIAVDDAGIAEEATEAGGESATAGGVGEDLARWSSQVSGAASALPEPSLGDAPAGAARVRTSATTSTTAMRGRRGGVARDAVAAVEPPPEDVEVPAEPPPSPVPAADQAVEEASDQRLPEQTLPSLQRSPRGTMPTIRTNLAPDLGTRLTPPAPAAEEEGAGAEGTRADPNVERGEAINEAAGRGPEDPDRAADAPPLTLVDTVATPSEAPPFNPSAETRQQLVRVLAQALRNPDETADQIVEDARKEAYPRQTLNVKYPEIGSELADELATDIGTRVRAIADQAGISADELDAAVEGRSDTLETAEGEARDELTEAASESREELDEEGQETADSVAGAREAVDENTERQAAAASGEDSPEVIEMKRDRMLRGVARTSARQDVFYEQAGGRRERALTAAGQTLEGAYTRVAREEQRELIAAAEEDEDRTEAEARADGEGGFVWAQESIREIRRRVGVLKTAAATTTREYRSGMEDAATEARRLIREWAGGQIEENSSFWQRIWRMFTEWAQDARDDSAAWEEARAEAERNALVNDLGFVSSLETLAARGIDHNALLADRSLSDEQRAIVRAYFEGDNAGNPIAAIAAGMRQRVSAERKPGLIRSMKQKVVAKPQAEWETVGQLGASESPGFNAYTRASQFHEAVDQWGTDEALVYRALAGLTPTQAAAVRNCYAEEFGGDLSAELEDELSGAELTRAEALLEGDQSLADAAALNEAVSGWGTDEATIMTVLRGKTEEERERILAAYQEQYGVDLREDLRGDMEDHDLDRAEALLDGDTARADAIALDQAMYGGILGWGTDEEDINQVYDQVRRDVEAEAAANGWDTARIEEEIRRRNGAIEDSYETEYGDPERTDGECALRAAFADEMEGPDLDLANALADNDMVAADAARLEVERRGFTTDDDVVNGILRSQYRRARTEVERDLRLDLQNRAEIARLRGEPWSRENWASERNALTTRINEESRERGLEYMGELEDRYDSEYSRWGSGGLQVLIAFNMSGNDEEMARDLLNQGGYLEPEQEIHYAIDGPGTDVDALRSTLAGRSPAEIERIRTAWERANPGEDFDDRVLSELSGRDEFDFELMLEGEPQTPEERLERARRRLDYERNAYWLGNMFSDEERERMDRRSTRLEEDFQALEGLEPGTPEYAVAHADFALANESFDRSIEDHRRAVDTLADTAATVAAIAATVVVIVGAIVLTVVTGGAAAPGIGAAVAAVMSSATVAATAAGAAAVATVATKLALRGSAYGVEEMGLDIAVGVVDVAAAALTAGMGNALLRVVDGMPMSTLARMAASNRATTRLLAHGLAEGAEGVASTLPSALTGNMLNERNWRQGSPFTNIMTGTLIETGIAAGLSGGLGSLGGLGAPPGAARNADADEFLPGGRRIMSDAESPDVLARRGTPADRLAMWQDYQTGNPGRSYSDFLEDLDAGIVGREADEAATRSAQRAMRGELLSGIPPAQRGQFADTTVDVVSDADFERLTRSAGGQAVVVIEDGRPRVIMRESADPRVLREEGIHLLQSRDPRFARHFDSLDESVLRNWDSLDLADQLRLYRNKLDLEIDAQDRLIRGLSDDIAAAADDPALQRSLRRQLGEAEEALGNLRSRLDEVTDLPAADRVRMARGELNPPDFLDQPPRLFSKAPLPPRVDADVSLMNTLREAVDAEDVSKARRTLNRLRGRAKSTPAFAEIYEDIARQADGLDPERAVRMLAQVDEVLNSGRRSADLEGFLRATRNMDDPEGFLKTVAKVASGDDGSIPAPALRSVADAAEQLSASNPAAARELVDTISDSIDDIGLRAAAITARTKDATPISARSLGGMLEALAGSNDPVAFARRLRQFTGILASEPHGLSDRAMRRVSDAMARLAGDPGRSRRFVDELVSTLAARPTRTGELDGFIRAAASSADPAAMLRATRRITTRVGGVTAGTIESIGRAVGKLEGVEAEGFLRRVNNLLDSQPGRGPQVVRLLGLSGDVPAVRLNKFIDDVDRLMTHNAGQLSEDAVEVMARKAAAGTVDVDWALSRNFDPGELEFMASDPNTPWRTLREFATSPRAQAELYGRVQSALRGFAGEMEFERVAEAFQNLGLTIRRQWDIVGSRPDFVLELGPPPNPLLKGVEVKAWSAESWERSVRALGRMLDGETLSSDDFDFANRLRHLVRQLKNAKRAARGNPPVLVLSDQFRSGELTDEGRRLIQRFLDSEIVPEGTSILFLSETDIERRWARLMAIIVGDI
ncbi:MAG: hypothetical protein GY906_13915 [bacterium]|nr:hypothetical protein [bacterium]